MFDLDLLFGGVNCVIFPKLRSSDIVTPRYLVADALASSFLWRNEIDRMVVLSLVTTGMKSMSQSSSQIQKHLFIGCLFLTVS